MSWYHIPGNQQDVAVFTRITIARNLSGHPFPSRLDAAGARAVLEAVGGVFERNGFTRTDPGTLSRTAAEALAEKRYVSPRFIAESLPHALFLNEPCNLAVTVCEDDHIRIRCILSGLALKDAYEGAGRVETLLDSALELAFDEKLGYLTANPTELGTALRGSVTVCLPMLGGAGRVEALSRSLEQTGLCLRGSTVDPVAAGWLYRIYNRTTLGQTEEEVLNALEGTVQHLIEAERQAREGISGTEREKLTDRILRAEGILRHAHMIPISELPSLLGLMRLGAAMGLTPAVKVEALTALLVEAMPATLTLGAEPPPVTDAQRELLRAKVVRDRLFGAEYG
ncbi:MAG: hypothetical protein J6K29_02950 [Clostridia bacterium]|nr:hypothetical protein [Clostridia bacterium]